MLNRDRAIKQTGVAGGTHSTRNEFADREKQFGALKDALPAILGADPLRQQYHSRASFLDEQFSPAKLKDKIAPKKSWVASGRIRTLRNSSEYLEPDVSTDTLRGARRANPSQSSTVKLPAIY